MTGYRTPINHYPSSEIEPQMSAIEDEADPVLQVVFQNTNRVLRH